MKTFSVDILTESTRIDKYLSDVLEESRNTIQSLIKKGLVLANNQIVKPNYKVKTGDVIEVHPFEEEPLKIEPEAVQFDIVYEDEFVAVIDKPTGLVVHPAPGHPNGTLVNGLLYFIDDFEYIKGEYRPGIVHRIDKDTSGLLIVAKNNESLAFLSDQIKDHKTHRSYVALVEGVIAHTKGKIDAPIGRHKSQRQNMAVSASGKPSITHFEVLERFESHTLVKCVLETGRTHQIRVHMRYIGHPIVGDPKYGYRSTDIEFGQYLHAESIGFTHPSTGEYLSFTSPLPNYFKQKLIELRRLHG
jgi:23S rRNA pseudouridine1911/1915/1917 synthase